MFVRRITNRLYNGLRQRANLTYNHVKEHCQAHSHIYQLQTSIPLIVHIVWDHARGALCGGIRTVQLMLNCIPKIEDNHLMIHTRRGGRVFIIIKRL